MDLGQLEDVAKMNKIDNSDVQTHLQILQQIISRMAGNSASCKTWCITLVSALLAAGFLSKSNSKVYLIAVLPLFLFAYLDSFYLAFEREFRKQYNKIVEKYVKGADISKDVYKIKGISGVKNKIISVRSAFKSWSVWPFYLSALLVIILAVIFLQPSPVVP
ncbi:MAG: hypothetical protein JW737_00225 [Acidobacteria bacterium]|nr:hypothetical protein [Acidobacteriota bacterium]